MSNPVLEAISERRSIRAYAPHQLTQEQLDAILQAAMQAPSARNMQPWHITVVQDKALLDRINQAFCAEARRGMPDEVRFSDPAYSVFYHAPTVIFVSCPSTQTMKYAETDTGIVIENIALAAHSLGLGSVILGMPRLAFDGEEAAALREKLAFPEGYEYCLSIAIGTPTATKEAHPVGPDRITIIR